MTNTRQFLFFLFSFLLIVSFSAKTSCQEVVFFDEGTDTNFYDQGIVNVNDMIPSSFEHTYPPAGSPTKWNDKIPCSTHAFKGSTSLLFNYTSASDGNWMVSIHRKGWISADLSNLDTIGFYLYSEENLPRSALPLIGITTANGNSEFDSLSLYNESIPANTWTAVSYPVNKLTGNVDLTQVKAIRLAQSEKNNQSRTLWIDEITVYKNLADLPKVSEFFIKGYDSHAHLSWEHPAEDMNYRIYASFDGGQSYEQRTETSNNYYLDFVPFRGKNTRVIYRIVTFFHENESAPAQGNADIRDFRDEELLEMIQEYAFRFFWEGAHQASGTSLERSNGSGNTTASGATGFQLMAMIVAHERTWRPKEEIKERILKILNFLETCERYHGAWSHWYNSNTKTTIPFSPNDDGGDIVETSFIAQGLIALRNYFSGEDNQSVQIREKATRLWEEIEWDWYRNNGENALYWHWSPNYLFEKNMKVSGWNECMGTYIMAASSPDYGIPGEVYSNGWARNGNIVNKRLYYGREISLAPNWGGPLFWIHYSHHGINPWGLRDEYANYWNEHVNTAIIHYEYARENPAGYQNYSDKCWGLTASDDPNGYSAHKPMDNDNGTISPTAALASMPYTPIQSLKALKYFYRERGHELFGPYGPYDAFNDTRNWIQQAYIGIDQGPIVIMIENYRSGLLWNNVMKDPDIQSGLEKLGFEYQVIAGNRNRIIQENFSMYPNPAQDKIYINLPESENGKLIHLCLHSVDGRMIRQKTFNSSQTDGFIDCTGMSKGVYIVRLRNNKHSYPGKYFIKD